MDHPEELMDHAYQENVGYKPQPPPPHAVKPATLAFTSPRRPEVPVCPFNYVPAPDACPVCQRCPECEICNICPICPICPTTSPVMFDCVLDIPENELPPNCCVNLDESIEVMPFSDGCPSAWDDPVAVCAALEQVMGLLNDGQKLIPGASIYIPDEPMWSAAEAGAIVAIANPSLCYVVHTDVQQFQQLSTTCSTSSNPDALNYLLSGVAISSGGNLFHTLPNFPTSDSFFVSALGAVLIMGDYILGFARAGDASNPKTEFRIATIYGSLEQIGFLLAGDIYMTPEPNLIFVIDTTVIEQAFVSDPTNQAMYFELTGTALLQELTDPEATRTTYNSRMCDAKDQIVEKMGGDGTAILSGTDIQINCDGGTAGLACVTQLSADDLVEATNISQLNLNSWTSVVIEILGDGHIAYDSLTCGVANCNNVVFAFTQASGVTVNVQADDSGAAIFAPVCNNVNVFMPTGDTAGVGMFGGIATGRDCHLTYFHNRLIGGWEDADEFIWGLSPLMTPKAIYCHCACSVADLTSAEFDRDCVAL
eukprot:Selendium_serpulae@DN6260_c1_g3_i7.p1